MSESQEKDTKQEQGHEHQGADFARGQRTQDVETHPGSEGGDFAAGQETQPPAHGHSDFARGERTVEDTDEGEADFARGQRTE